MSEQPRDWDREMADIDRAIAKQGGTPGAPGGGTVTPRSAPAPTGAPASPRPAAAPRRGSVAVTWLWVLLALGLAVALPLWPYQRSCGLQAAFFVGATGITLLVGGLAAISSWANRRGLAHVLSLAVMAWAAIVAAGEILPRVGYARETRTWTCVAAPAAAPAPAPTQAPAPTPAPAEAAPAPAQGQPNTAPASP